MLFYEYVWGKKKEPIYLKKAFLKDKHFTTFMFPRPEEGSTIRM